MKFLPFLLLSLALFATPSQEYFSVLKDHPKTHGSLGNSEKGEIEIFTSFPAIEETEKVATKRLIEKGIPSDVAKIWSQVGIIAQDQYLYWIRDAVLFPSGVQGTYDRIIWKSSLKGYPGVAVIPYLSNQRIILILHFRHATRSWELEIPRGSIEEGETILNAAIRELMEETGYRAYDSLLLGTLAVDSGILDSLIPVIACKAIDTQERNLEFSEAIHGNIILTFQELEEALLKGFCDVTIGDRTVRAAVRDPFLSYGLLQMKLRHWQD